MTLTSETKPGGGYDMVALLQMAGAGPQLFGELKVSIDKANTNAFHSIFSLPFPFSIQSLLHLV